MPILYSFLFIIIICSSIAILYVYQYNKIQHTKTKIEQAESLIDESLRNKYDTLLQFNDLLTEELKQEIFENIENLKNLSISNYDLDRKFTEYESTLNQIKIDKAKLFEKKNFKDLTNNIKSINEKLQAGKSYYNKYTNELNDYIRSFPSNIVAKLHGIDIKPFFDGKNMQDDITNDFKF